MLYTIKGSGTFVSPNLPVMTQIRSEKATLSAGVIIPDVRYSQYPELFKGMEDYFHEKHVDLMVCNTDDDPGRELAFIKRLVAARVDGIIIVPSAAQQLEGYAYLRKAKIPFVFWNRSVDMMPNIPQIALNGYHGGFIAARHLLSKGYEHISYLAPKRFRSSMDRFFGFDSALAMSGIETDRHIVKFLSEDENPEVFYTAADALLKSPNPPDAFLCFIDKMAPAVCKAISDNGLKVSDDVGVIGFESSIVWTDANMPPKLTYVGINSGKSGYLAARTLYHMMLAKEENWLSEMIVTRPELIIRETCLGKKRE